MQPLPKVRREAVPVPAACSSCASKQQASPLRAMDEVWNWFCHLRTQHSQAGLPEGLRRSQFPLVSFKIKARAHREPCPALPYCTLWLNEWRRQHKSTEKRWRYEEGKSDHFTFCCFHWALIRKLAVPPRSGKPTLLTLAPKANRLQSAERLPNWHSLPSLLAQTPQQMSEGSVLLSLSHDPLPELTCTECQGMSSEWVKETSLGGGFFEASLHLNSPMGLWRACSLVQKCITIQL